MYHTYINWRSSGSLTSGVHSESAVSPSDLEWFREGETWSRYSVCLHATIRRDLHVAGVHDNSRPRKLRERDALSPLGVNFAWVFFYEIAEEGRRKRLEIGIQREGLLSFGEGTIFSCSWAYACQHVSGTSFS